MHLWKKWNLRKKINVKDTWKYDSILAIKKSLVRIWLGFLKERFHRIIYYLMLYHILNHYK
jgi:hypothetical protein